MHKEGVWASEMCPVYESVFVSGWAVMWVLEMLLRCPHFMKFGGGGNVHKRVFGTAKCVLCMKVSLSQGGVEM